MAILFIAVAFAGPARIPGPHSDMLNSVTLEDRSRDDRALSLILEINL